MAAEIGERERRITHMALHDGDTDLPNRQALVREIAELEARIGSERLFVAALGVDRLTHVRGAIGHALFGELMGELGARLARLAPGTRPARLTTAILGVAFEAADASAAMTQAEALREALEAPVPLGGNLVDVSLTLGLAACAHGADRVASAIDRANIAVDQARAARRAAMAFDPGAYGDPAANLSLMSEMRASIEAGHMALYHQPKFDLRRRQVTATEALVRWIHPTRGFLPPDRFIGMAEETGHIRGLTEWVLAQAVRDQAALAAAGHELAVSVNVSGRLLSDLAFAETALALTADAPGDICFEITETAVVENPEVALAVIDRFAAAGIAVSIDDYGTGLSSLAYLKQIRASELKIDKSFVFAMGESQRDALLVRSTIDLAHGLGMKVTAEGIETETALALLAAMGCDLAQGYLIAKPMPLNALLNFLGEDVPALKSCG
jgi:EAL domain-containing protein (putative c-di-GMP-specific phosphodiesterase class I)/GGDEF domain-containing protein